MKIYSRIRIYNTKSDLFVYDKRKRKTTVIGIWTIARTNYSVMKKMRKYDICTNGLDLIC